MVEFYHSNVAKPSVNIHNLIPTRPLKMRVHVACELTAILSRPALDELTHRDRNKMVANSQLTLVIYNFFITGK